MKPCKFLMAFMAAALLASCSDDKDYSGDFGQIKVPDKRQLEQTAAAGDTQTREGVTFTAEAAWSSAIVENTRAGAPDWITISPDHGDTAGTYTIRIALTPNDTAAARSATITIVCGTSKIDIRITQDAPNGSGDDPEPVPFGRLAKITEYVEDQIETQAIFTYDDAGRRILSLMIYVYDDNGQRSLSEEWRFAYNSYNSGVRYDLIITEKRYDKLPILYGNEWLCTASLDLPWSARLEYATCNYIESDITHHYTYNYGNDGLSTIDDYKISAGMPDEEHSDRYTFDDGCLTMIEWGWDNDNADNSQTFSYSDDPDTWTTNDNYEYLFRGYPIINPAFYVISDPDYLQMLGFYGRQTQKLPVKVVTKWGNGSETERLAYKFYDFGNWKIGEQRDCMEISVSSDTVGESRFVLTFEAV